jgi:hypothetical protein
MEDYRSVKVMVHSLSVDYQYESENIRNKMANFLEAFKILKFVDVSQTS